MNPRFLTGLALTIFCLLAAPSLAADDAQQATSTPLFTEDGVPQDWIVRRWDDVGEAADEGVRWIVRDGVLQGSEPRGTWLMSDQEYGDFVLEFEFKLGPRGNSGVALRAPLAGDPAFDGLELQMADVRYNPRAIAPCWVMWHD